MVKETDLAYLAGIIDGEGMVNMFRYKHRTCVEIVICNTEPSIINKCVSIMEDLGSKPYVRFQDRIRSGWKPTWWIRVRNQKKCKIILESVSQYIIGKKAKSDLLLAYVYSRRGKKNSKLTPEEEQMICSIRKLNKRG